MDFRKINNPKRVSSDFLKKLAQTKPSGSYLAQDKWDGWRRPLIKENGVIRFANKGGEQARREMPSDLTEELSALLKNVDNVGLDTEWVGPRNKDAINATLGKNHNCIVVHDLHYLNGLWIGNQPASTRFANLTTLLELAKASCNAPRINLVRCWSKDWDKMFEDSKLNPLLEGVVIKDSSSLLGYPWMSGEDNIGWFKVKWRDIHEASNF